MRGTRWPSELVKSPRQSLGPKVAWRRAMMRCCASIVLLALCAGAACGGKAAVSSTNPEGDPPPAASTPAPTPVGSAPVSSRKPPPTADASAHCPPPADPSWTLAPSAYDATCAQDDDCTPAFFGTTVCTDPTLALCTCANAAVAKTSEAVYRAAAAALDDQCRACRPPDSQRGCFCPAFKARCGAAGTCVLCLPTDATCGQ